MGDAPEDDLPAAVAALIATARGREPLGTEQPGEVWVRPALARGAAMYRNRNERLGVDFEVDRLAFPHLQTMDPRVVRIAPGATNERHRHAHESLFVVLAGRGEVLVGEQRLPVGAGDVAFVPRWIFHQTRNTDPAAELVVLAITDFGFTSAVLGDYDQRTRLARGGDDVR
jgi:mannose-6-phosphate isomerase-like protein (cupin superfamily)